MKKFLLILKILLILICCDNENTSSRSNNSLSQNNQNETKIFELLTSYKANNEYSSKLPDILNSVGINKSVNDVTLDDIKQLTPQNLTKLFNSLEQIESSPNNNLPPQDDQNETKIFELFTKYKDHNEYSSKLPDILNSVGINKSINIVTSDDFKQLTPENLTKLSNSLEKIRRIDKFFGSINNIKTKKLKLIEYKVNKLLNGNNLNTIQQINKADIENLDTNKIKQLTTNIQNIENSKSTNEDLKSFWKDSMKNRPEEFFEDIMNIYDFDFLGKPEHKEFIKTFLTDKEKQDYLGCKIIYNAKDDNGDNTSLEDLENSVLRRLPVHIAGIKSPKWTKPVLENLGYDPIEDLDKVKQDIRYVSVGKAYWNNLNATNKPKTFYVAHTWGLNFESTTTDDYKKYIDTSGNLKRKEYAICVGRMIENILIAAQDKVTELNKDKIFLRICGIGLGYFASNAKLKDQIFMNEFYYKTFNALVNKPQFNKVNLDFCDRSDKIKTYSFPISEKTRIFTGNDKANLFDLGIDNQYDANSIVMATNAWDNRSFIGNGGSTDPSVDGWMVAVRKPGPLVKDPNPYGNSSYLHNPFFGYHGAKAHQSAIPNSEFENIANTL